MVVSDDATAALDPFSIDSVGYIAADPHEEDQHHADRKWEAEIVVRVLGQFGPSGEGLRPYQWQQQRLAKRDVEARQSQDDEAGRRHPVHEPFEPVETHDSAAGTTFFDPHHAAPKIEDHQKGQHAEDRDGPDPAKSDFVEMEPLAPHWLLDHV